MGLKYRFDRMELAGSLGDIGVLIPIAIGMIVINGIDPVGLFLTVGLYYILSGMYYGVPAPVQPMKVIGAYAIATGVSAVRISASGALMAIFLLIIGGTNAITLIGKYVPKSVVRGVQISTGTLLMVSGVKFMTGASKFQVLKHAAEPWLTIQTIGPVPIGIVLGVICGIITLLLLDSRRFPAGLVVVTAGFIIGLLFGTHEGFDRLEAGFFLPKFLPFSLPTYKDFAFALFTLALPQLPMTIGNAVIANADLSQEYFGTDSKKVTYRSLCLSMALANLVAFLTGGMPLCHGAGGLAAHFRFGARTAGSNVIIGAVFLGLALFLGIHAVSIVYLMPISVLGVLLLFSGSQLALTVIDMKERRDLFVVLMIMGITIASNLAVGFISGIFIAYVLKWEKLSV